MTVMRFFINDVRDGFAKEWWKYLLAAVMFALLCLVLSVKSASELDARTLGDYLVSTFVGMKEYAFDPNDPFQFPAAWMLLLLLIAYGTLNYPYRDMLGFGRQAMLYSGDRWRWWVAKCLWVVASVFLFYLIGFVVVVLWTACLGGNMTLGVSRDLPSLLLFNSHALPPYPWSVAGFLALLPLATAALCMIQLVISLVLKPIISFLCTVVILFFSAFYLTPWLLGNYLMAARSSAFLTHGMNPELGAVFSLVLVADMVVAGAIIVNRIDLFAKGHIE